MFYGAPALSVISNFFDALSSEAYFKGGLNSGCTGAPFYVMLKR